MPIRGSRYGCTGPSSRCRTSCLSICFRTGEQLAQERQEGSASGHRGVCRPELAQNWQRQHGLVLGKPSHCSRRQTSPRRWVLRWRCTCQRSQHREGQHHEHILQEQSTAGCRCLSQSRKSWSWPIRGLPGTCLHCSAPHGPHQLWASEGDGGGDRTPSRSWWHRWRQSSRNRTFPREDDELHKTDRKSQSRRWRSSHANGQPTLSDISINLRFCNLGCIYRLGHSCHQCCHSGRECPICRHQQSC
jgi:hypothetical protein